MDRTTFAIPTSANVKTTDVILTLSLADERLEGEARRTSDCRGISIFAWYCTRSNCAQPYARTPEQETNAQPLKLLVLQLALQFLRLCNLPYRLVVIVLVDCVSVILDGEQATVDISECHIERDGYLRLSHNIP